MISAKGLADDMVNALNVNSGFLKSFAGGGLELPVIFIIWDIVFLILTIESRTVLIASVASG